MSKLRITIVGAGLAGLTLASAITFMDKKEEIEIDIYESTPELGTAGAGINLWPRTYELLSNIGLKDEVLRFCDLAGEDTSLIFEFRKSDQLNGIPILSMYDKGGLVRIHRSELQRILVNQATKRCRLHLNMRLVSYTEDQDNVQLTFNDGSTRTCDLLVGADGIKSTVRKAFFSKQPGEQNGESNDPIWTGSCAYRGIVPRDVLLEKFPGHRAALGIPVLYIGKHKHIVAYPMSQGQSINFAGFGFSPENKDTHYEGPQVMDVSKEVFLSTYDGWEPEVQALIECIPKPTKWFVHHILPLKSYGKNRVLLLGDSAHAMAPYTGAGAGQAMEDAYVLAHLLTRSNITDLSSHVPSITHAYDAIRRPFATAVQKMSVTCGMLEFLIDVDGDLVNIEEGDDQVPHEVLVRFVNKVENHWRWLWNASLEEECQRGIKLLRERVGQ